MMFQHEISASKMPLNNIAVFLVAQLTTGVIMRGTHPSAQVSANFICMMHAKLASQRMR
jgi:hypothetical protein